MKASPKHNVPGIYCIRNLINNKVYIGKAHNIFRRIREHIYRLEKSLVTDAIDPDENSYLQNSWKKYGKNSFEYFVLEVLELDPILISRRELYWMKQYESLDRSKGYNLRSDSDSGIIVHELTKAKMSDNLKKQWKNGIRSSHSKKLSDNWKNNIDRKKDQATLFSKTLSKYKYVINNECLNYKELVDKGYKNVLATFFQKKTNKVLFKGVLIERVIIDDIVRSS